MGLRLWSPQGLLMSTAHIALGHHSLQPFFCSPQELFPQSDLVKSLALLTAAHSSMEKVGPVVCQVLSWLALTIHKPPLWAGGIVET